MPAVGDIDRCPLLYRDRASGKLNAPNEAQLPEGQNDVSANRVSKGGIKMFNAIQPKLGQTWVALDGEILWRTAG